MSGVVDRSLAVVVGVSWPVMVGVGASLPETYRGWFRAGVSVGGDGVVGFGGLVQGLVGSLGSDVVLVDQFVGLSPMLVGLGLGSLLMAAGAKPAARWVFKNAPLGHG